MPGNAPAQATERVLGHLIKRLGLREQHAEGSRSAPLLTLMGTSGARGAVRCYRGDGLDKLLHLELLDGGNLEASMLTAFSATDSAAPHLVLDAARIGRDYAVFVDLVPRVDLAVHPEYTQTIYRPLESAAAALHSHDKLRPSPVPSSLAPFVSPWMRGFRCDLKELDHLFEHVAPYVSEWAALLKRDLLGLADGVDLPARDRAHRRAMFDRSADPVWDVLAGVLGHDAVDSILTVLREPG